MAQLRGFFHLVPPSSASPLPRHATVNGSLHLPPGLCSSRSDFLFSALPSPSTPSIPNANGGGFLFSASGHSPGNISPAFSSIYRSICCTFGVCFLAFTVTCFACWKARDLIIVLVDPSARTIWAVTGLLLSPGDFEGSVGAEVA
jgi:hypothetical protein